jgi:hypothetical protein
MKKLLSCLFVILFVVSCATNSVKTENPAFVSFDFEGNGKSALTFWRKINSDGTKGSVFSVGGNTRVALMMNNGFKNPKSETIKLDVGTYYLDSFQIDYSNGYIVSEGKHYLMRNGWDKKNNKPYFLAFTVKEGETLVLPKVKVVAKTIGRNAIFRFEFEDENNVFTIGDKAKQF